MQSAFALNTHTIITEICIINSAQQQTEYHNRHPLDYYLCAYMRLLSSIAVISGT